MTEHQGGCWNGQYGRKEYKIIYYITYKVRSVMSLNEGAKTRVRVDFELSEEFWVNVEMQQRSVPSPFPLAVGW